MLDHTCLAVQPSCPCFGLVSALRPESAPVSIVQSTAECISQFATYRFACSGALRGSGLLRVKSFREKFGKSIVSVPDLESLQLGSCRRVRMTTDRKLELMRKMAFGRNMSKKMRNIRELWAFRAQAALQRNDGLARSVIHICDQRRCGCFQNVSTNERNGSRRS